MIARSLLGAAVSLGAVAAAEPAQGLTAREEGVASNRGLIAATAVTVPSGHVEATVQARVPHGGMAGINVGVTRSTELWMDGGLARDDRPPNRGNAAERTYAVGLKQVFVQTTHVALTGSLRAVRPRDGYKSLGIAGTVCADPACRVALSATGGVRRCAIRRRTHRDRSRRGDPARPGDPRAVAVDQRQRAL